MSRIVIGFTGKMGCGKSTAAKILVEHGFTRIRFAQPLKSMMACLGLSEDQIEGHLKETPCIELCGKSPRYGMQTIGTEWGRDTIHPDLWINAWKRAVEKAPGNVVVDDVRFLNEATALMDMDGGLIRIVRGTTIQPAHSQHASEAMDFEADHTIKNNTTLEEFNARIEAIAVGLMTQRERYTLGVLSDAGYPVH